jgi:hypothetical protein
VQTERITCLVGAMPEILAHTTARDERMLIAGFVGCQILCHFMCLLVPVHSFTGHMDRCTKGLESSEHSPDNVGYDKLQLTECQLNKQRVRLV